LKENQAMKLLFDATKLERFWCSNMESYRKLSAKALVKKGCEPVQ